MLERLDLRTGERKRLIVNGADPTISPTADRIVYVHLTQGQPDRFRAISALLSPMPLLRAQHAPHAVFGLDLFADKIAEARFAFRTRRGAFIPRTSIGLSSGRRARRSDDYLSAVRVSTSHLLVNGADHCGVHIAMDRICRKRLRRKHGKCPVSPAVCRTSRAISYRMRVSRSAPWGDYATRSKRVLET